MAKVRFNPNIAAVQGKSEDIVFKVINGKHFSTRRAHSEKPATENQRKWRARFKRGSDFAKEAKRDPELRAFYLPLAEKADRRVREIILSDVFGSPVIKSFDLSGFTGKPGSHLSIDATDNFGVVSVEVSLNSRSGFWEKGMATQESGLWRYQVKGTPPAEPIEVRIVASDRPRNETEARFTWLPPRPAT